MRLELAAGSVDNDGETIYYELVTTGADDDRPVVVLSHGAGGSHAIWYQQIPALGRAFRVLTWDSRGFGNSTNRTDAIGADTAADDLAAVFDALGIEHAHLVGQSLGGWHSAAFAVAHPERALSLILADTVAGLWTPELRAAFADVVATGALTGAGPTVVGAHRALWSGTAERDLAQAFLYQALGSFHTPPMDRLGPTIEWSISHETIAALGIPVLFVAGSHDELFPAPLLAASSRLVPGADYVEIPAAGHSPYFEQPDAWNDAVSSFLASV